MLLLSDTGGSLIGPFDLAIPWALLYEWLSNSSVWHAQVPGSSYTDDLVKYTYDMSCRYLTRVACLLINTP